jgi:hypothetical protein
LAAAVAGLVLIILGWTLPVDGLPSQSAVPPVRSELVVAGERLYSYGLIGHGVLLLAGAVVAARWRPLLPQTEPLYRPPPLSGPDQHSDSLPLLLTVLGAAFLLRLIGLNMCLWYDEVVTLTEFVRLPLAELVRNYADQNQHPLFSLAARGTVLLCGESPWALRLPAVLFGVASLWALYRFAQRFAPWPEPLLAMLLLAVAYHHVWFSQNARGYTALLFWSLLGSELFVDNLREPRLARSLAYAAVMALALYTHLTAGFIVAGHGLIYLGLLARKSWTCRRLGRGDWLPLCSFALLVSLTFQLYALVLPQVLGSFRGQVGGIRIQTWTNPVWGFAQVLQSLQLGFMSTAGALVAAVVVVGGLASFARRNFLMVALLVLPCVLGLGVMLLLKRHLYPRFFFTVFALAMMVIVRGTMVWAWTLAALTPRASRDRFGRAASVAFGGILFLAFVFSLQACYRLPKQDYAGALAYVHTTRQPDEPVVVVGMASIPVTRYYGPTVKLVETAAQLEAVRASHAGRSTWLIYTFRDHMTAFHPDLLGVIERDFVRAGVFPGTVGGGEVLVCRASPLTALSTDHSLRLEGPSRDGFSSQ